MLVMIVVVDGIGNGNMNCINLPEHAIKSQNKTAAATYIVDLSGIAATTPVAAADDEAVPLALVPFVAPPAGTA